MPDAHFETVGEVKSLGDNPLTNEYSFQDPISTQMQDKELQYRIKMIDHDEKIQYSNTIGLNTKIVGEISVFPNPFQNNLTIAGLIPNDSYRIELTNLIGSPMIEASYSSNLQGLINLSVMNEIPIGIYFIRISNSEGLVYFSKLCK